MTRATLNFDRLLKLRLIVVRFGEMDLAKWWNTRGQLGQVGTAAIRRDFPRTHYFAQARSVFAVAAHRSREIFDPRDSVTLWRLPETIEEEFEANWSTGWIRPANGTLFFTDWRISKKTISKLRFTHSMPSQTANQKCRHAFARSAEGRAVPLSEAFSGTDQDIALLALGFARGETGSLAVPYARETPH